MSASPTYLQSAKWCFWLTHAVAQNWNDLRKPSHCVTRQIVSYRTSCDNSVTTFDVPQPGCPDEIMRWTIFQGTVPVASHGRLWC